MNEFTRYSGIPGDAVYDLIRKKDSMQSFRITAQVLNGATGEVREIVANVKAASEQDAVDKLFSKARRDDYYYRFLGHAGVINPTGGVALVYQNQTYYSAE
jgi:hypothetical protein